jgi:2-polyprenyl-3-methyl-5-hydroxy-6-metoxy-1,4-benzoquinol methylase
MIEFEPLHRCLACDSLHLVPYLDLGAQPLANAYRKIGHETPLPRYPLELRFCARCWHSQLSLAVDREAIFRHYLYVSGTTDTFRRHCRDLALEALARLTARSRFDPRVLDIACNDGTLLEQFRSLGAEVVGVDPAENLQAETNRKGIAVVSKFWGTRPVTDEVLYILGDKQLDIITATNVLGHVPDPLAFLRECHVALEHDGLVVVEAPPVSEILARGQFDQVYHEHVSYFSARSFRTLAERAGFVVTHTTRTEIHGGSLRFFLKKSGLPDPTVEQVEASERDFGLYDRGCYKFLERWVEQLGGDFRERVLSARQEGRIVVGYGAAAKGSTALGAFRVDLPVIYDDNPLKQGHVTPHGSTIISPEYLAGVSGPLEIVVLAWNFLDEVRRRVEDIRGRGRGDRLLVYHPHVHEVLLP